MLRLFDDVDHGRVDAGLHVVDAGTPARATSQDLEQLKGNMFITSAHGLKNREGFSPYSKPWLLEHTLNSSFVF